MGKLDSQEEESVWSKELHTKWKGRQKQKQCAK